MGECDVVIEPLLRDRDTGLVASYGDRNFFNVFNPGEARIRQRQGKVRYRNPGGESLLDMRARVVKWLKRAKKKYSGKRVLVITHYPVMVCAVSHLEEDKFTDYERNETAYGPPNCAVTIYRGKKVGRKCGLRLHMLNKVFYD